MRGVLLVWLAILSQPLGAMAQSADPLSIVKAGFAAENAGNVDATVDFFADDAVIVSTRGQRFEGKASIRRFIQSNVNAKVIVNVDSLNPQVEGDKVITTQSLTSEFFARWGVGPVTFRTEIIVQGGKIKAQENFYVLESLAKMQLACQSPVARSYGTQCEDFVRPAKQQTARVLGVNIPSGEFPAVAKLRPFTADTNYMGHANYLRYLMYLATDRWLTYAQAARVVEQQQSR